MKISKILKGGAIAVFAAVLIAAPTFAGISDCVGEGKQYPNLSTNDGGGKYPVKCPTTITDNGRTVPIYGKSAGDCASAGTLATNPDSCEASDLNTVIKTIVNTLIFVIGIVAVIMIILGGISYATSQGDPAKVKKGKDTVLYGIIGLVIALLAYAIVNFVLNAMNG